MKDSNRKFEGFAHTLIAESLQKWSSCSKFVEDKLIQRLKVPIDELDSKIAEVIFSNDPNAGKDPITSHECGKSKKSGASPLGEVEVREN